MNRTVRDKKVFIKPVKKIELNESNVKLRIIAVVAMIVIAATAFGFGIHSLIKGDAGWHFINCVMDDYNVSGDFTFVYYTENRKVKSSVEALYSKACVDAFSMFSSNTRSEEVNNIWTINNAPNKEAEVSKTLYDALKRCVDNNALYLYLGPLYYEYEGLCLSDSDEEAKEFDPERSEAQREYFDKIIGFVSSGKDIELRFLGDNRVMLYVSKDYASFAQNYGGIRFIDLGWMKNAFIIDYIAETMIEAGYTHGSISSYDGYSRCLDDSGEEYKYALMMPTEDKLGLTAYGIYTYNGRRSHVVYRDYMLYGEDKIRYYNYEDGTVIFPYLTYPEGKMSAKYSTLYCYSDSLSCADIMLKTAGSYIYGRELDNEGDIKYIIP